LFPKNQKEEIMKVLNVSSGDLVGRRFNGYDMFPFLEDLGVDSSLAVFWRKESSNSKVHSFSDNWSSIEKLRIARNLYGLSRKFGYETLEYPWAKDLFKLKSYGDADVIHLQIVQNATLDLRSIKRIISEKPTVWTWHDSWPVTGHCVHPMDCQRWQRGCGKCPDLDVPFKIGRDLTRQNRTAKNQIVNLNYKLHITTDWFDQYLQNSGSSYPKPSIFPFGLDMDVFKPTDTKVSRQRLGISETDFVIGIRATSEAYKGLDDFLRAMTSRKWMNTTIVTVQDENLLFLEAHGLKVIELGWIDNEKLLDFYNSLDVFVMPSSYETFGFMCVESMACAKPVIVASQTPMSSHINSNEGGISLPKLDSDSILASLDLLRDNPKLKGALGKRGQELASQKFGISKYCSNIFSLYQDAIKDYSHA
jgi:glycosyltransferase involved in cell wall biosynthesis